MSYIANPSVSYGNLIPGAGSTVRTAAGPGGAQATAFTRQSPATGYQQPNYNLGGYGGGYAQPQQPSYDFGGYGGYAPQVPQYNIGGYGGYQQPAYPQVPQYIAGYHNVNNINLPPVPGLNQVRVSRDVTNFTQPIYNYFTDILEKQQNTYFQPVNFLQQIIKQIPGIQQYLPEINQTLPIQYQGYNNYGYGQMGGYGQQQYGGYNMGGLGGYGLGW